MNSSYTRLFRWVYVSLVLFALMTPIGGVAGSLVHAAPQIHPLLRDWIVLVMQGLAVGVSGNMQ